MAVTSGTSGGPSRRWYRVRAVTAMAGTAVADYASILPAALSAARYRQSFIAGWLSRGGGAPLELVTNAGPWPAPGPVGGPDDREPPRDSAAAGRPGVLVDMLFPWGARGAVIEQNMIDELDQLVWAACPGRHVLTDSGRLTSPRAADGSGPAALFESALQNLMGRPFGWLIVADPTDLLEAEVAELQSELSVLRRYTDEQERFEASLAEQRLAELDQFREAGLWQVRVLVGAATEQDLDVIGPVLVGSADLSAHPYRLRCPASAQEFADVLATRLTDFPDGSTVPFTATAGTLTALTGLPRHEVPGVRLMRAGLFAVNAAAPAPPPAIELGRILDGRDCEVGTLGVPLRTLTGHALVTGAVGSGKSHTVRHLLEQLAGAGIGWLAVQTAKSGYAAAMAARLAGLRGPAEAGRGAGHVVLINPADPDAVPLSVNPLAPEPGYPVRAHIDLVRALFLASFDARESFSQVISQALECVYAECGWDLQARGRPADQDTPPAVPTLDELHAAAIAVNAGLGYGRDLQASLRGFLDSRIGSLCGGAAARFLQGGHPADVGALLAGNVILTLEDIASEDDKAFVTGALIIRIVEHLRLRAPDRGEELRHVLVLEQAHQLLRAGRDGAGARAVELFASMLAEIRGYGEGIVVSEPMPARLASDVVRDTGLTVLHRLPAAADRRVVGAAMNLSKRQSRQVVSLPPGEAVVFAAGLDGPMRVRVPSGVNRERGHATAAEPPEEAGAGPQPVGSAMLSGRRSPSCSASCAAERPCTLAEIRAADLIASSPAGAQLRVWAEVYVLAYLVNRPRPRVPVPLRRRWAELPERLRDCALATALDQAIGRRRGVLRASYDPAALSAACAASAAGLLAGGNGAGTMPGTGWVIPQLQWLHELERVCPIDAAPPDPFALAPPLDFALAGLPGEADVKIGQRVSGLRRHPLSMEVTANRLIAWTALLGEDDNWAFIEDLAAIAIGVSHRSQLRQAAGEMGVTGWLETVLSWPRRFIVGAGEFAAGADEAAAGAGEFAAGADEVAAGAGEVAAGAGEQASSPAREPERVAG